MSATTDPDFSYPYGYFVTWTTTFTETDQSREQQLEDALVDIAHDSGTLEAAQRRAREVLH